MHQENLRTFVSHLSKIILRFAAALGSLCSRRAGGGGACEGRRVMARMAAREWARAG